MLAIMQQQRESNNSKQDRLLATTSRIEHKVDSLGTNKRRVVDDLSLATEPVSNFVEEERFDDILFQSKRKDVLSLDKVKAKCKTEATRTEYVRINRDFNNWFDKNYPSVDTVEQEHIEEYVALYTKEGKSTYIVVSALKVQFEKILRKGFNWSGLAQGSEHKHEHKAWDAEVINKWIDAAENVPVY